MELLTLNVKMETTFETADEEIDVVTVDANDERLINFDEISRELLDNVKESGNHSNTYSNTENIRPFFVKDEEIDVVSVDPNDEKIIQSDLLTRKLSADYDEESDYYTETDSDTEDVKNFSLNEEIDVVGVDLNHNDTIPNTVPDVSKSLNETNETLCEEAASKISRKRKRQDLDSADSTSKTYLKRCRTNAKVDESNNLFNHSKSISSKKTATSQKQQASSLPVSTKPIISSKYKQFRAASYYSTCYCPQCKKTVKPAMNNPKRLCPKCKTAILYECKRCGHRRRAYLNLFKHLRNTCYSSEIGSCNYTTQKDKLDDGRHMDVHFSASGKTQRAGEFENAMKPSLATASADQALTSSTEAQNDTCFRIAAYTTYYCFDCKKTVNVTGNRDNRQCQECNRPALYQCKKCNLQHKSYVSFLRHLRHVCYPTEILRCDHCNYATHRKDYLSKHIMNQHTKSPKLEGVLKCSQCSFRTNFKTILNHHMDTHLLEKVFAESEVPQERSKTNVKEQPSVKIGYCVKCALMKPFKTGQCPKCRIKMMLVCHLCCARFGDHTTLNRHIIKWHKNQL